MIIVEVASPTSKTNNKYNSIMVSYKRKEKKSKMDKNRDDFKFHLCCRVYLRC